MNENIIAHVRQEADGTWAKPHRLSDHLMGTADLAEEFARVFASESWARACALIHDVGKGTLKWQKYIRLKSGYSDDNHQVESNAGKEEHSIYGAKFAEELLGKGVGRILSYCIAGHHAGLADWLGDQGSLAYRLQNCDTSTIPEKFRNIVKTIKPLKPPRAFNHKGLDIALWIRMLFSCLVDADYLDTESYMEPDKSKSRASYKSLKEMRPIFDEHIKKKTDVAQQDKRSPVYLARQQVLSDCLAAAHLEPGLFSLTVPTGGGKTLSSLAFALEHAEQHEKRRVIYVIPYTSIIEQNADVFREALGKDQVVEHHSNLDDNVSTDESRLAAETWDAPVIVTTTVQFFESLFAAKPGRCRKLHNIANSIVILDEAQLVPVEFLAPILEVLRLLCDQYGVTVVFCTATQPAFEAREGFKGLPVGSIREIISDVSKLYEILKRVKVDTVDTKTPRAWEEIAVEISQLDRVLCVVSDRKSCRELFKLMPEGTYHLSALMCAQHRSDLIKKIKSSLQQSGSVRVISTQLVEAGVDIDFPVVYRAMAGLDSIAQAAGRCNREGLLDGLGKVVVFVPPNKPPVGILRKAAETAVGLLDAGLEDPIDNKAFGPYFSELYWKANNLDEKGILKLLAPDRVSGLGIQFREAAAAFTMIDDKMQRSIFVPYREGEDLLKTLEKNGPERWLLRKLQRYVVNIYLNQFKSLLERGSLEEVWPEFYMLKCGVEYNEKMGLLVDELPDMDFYNG